MITLVYDQERERLKERSAKTLWDLLHDLKIALEELEALRAQSVIPAVPAPRHDA